MGLLLAALTSATLLAYFAQRSRSQGSRSTTNSEELEAAPSASPSAAKARTPGTAPGSPGAQPSLGEPTGNEPLTPEQIDAMRGEPSQVNPDVRDRGIDGLLGPIECEPPSRLFEAGRKGPGGVGCFLEGPDKVPLRVKRWALKNPAGMLDAGDFEFGKRTGTWVQYHPNGFKAAEGEYDQDKRVGVWREWDDAGRVFAVRTYKDGALNGVTVVFRGATPAVEVWDSGRRRGDPPLPTPAD